MRIKAMKKIKNIYMLLSDYQLKKIVLVTCYIAAVNFEIC